MSEITVTMPLKEYEAMKAEIRKLKELDIHNFINREYTSVTANQFTETIDTDAIRLKHFHGR